jgi:hypothetical protein
MKANASEPLMTGRNQVRRRQNRDFKRGSGSSVGEVLFATDTTSGLKAARAWIGLRYGTLEPVASMQRERLKRRPREADSTNARHRGGMIRSSEDRP